MVDQMVEVFSPIVPLIASTATVLECTGEEPDGTAQSGAWAFAPVRSR